MNMTPAQFVEMITGQSYESPFRIGTIPGTYSGGRPTVQFDGESTASSKAYPYLSPYVPQAGDRVLLARVSAGWVVLGKIT